jgi:hypothetical protein
MARRRLLLLAALVVIVAGYLLLRGGGVRVIVTNNGQATLEKVRVDVTGRSYDLGDVPPGGSREVGVEPTGESHVELSFTDQGRQVRLVTGTRFEPGYRGEIIISVRDGKIEHVKDSTRAGPF